MQPRSLDGWPPQAGRQAPGLERAPARRAGRGQGKGRPPGGWNNVKGVPLGEAPTSTEDTASGDDPESSVYAGWMPWSYASHWPLQLCSH